MSDKTRSPVAPPPPHDPTERVLVTRIDGWEVRDFAPDDSRYSYFLRYGFAHLQLWHAASGVSLLTPSRLTADQYELFPFAGWKLRHADWATLRALVAREHAVSLPALVELRAVERWFVRRLTIEAAPTLLRRRLD
jgi:hypothetical protein